MNKRLSSVLCACQLISPWYGGFALCLLSLAAPACRSPENPGPSAERVVVYCALDREFAEEILGEFSRRTGLEVVPRFDTEANKSVGLFEDLVREADRPRCDVHWNNEILATLRLQQQGLLEPYASPSAQPFPSRYQAADHSWHAFAARARILLINTQMVPAQKRPKSIRELSDPRWRNRGAIAKPQFGTTASEAACLFQVWGQSAASDFYRKLQANGVHVVSGNKQVAGGVGKGQFALGLTDTDDAMGEIDAGRPVAIVFPDQDAPADGKYGTLFLPNTVAVIRGCPNPEGARKLVDFLLSPQVETMLARCPSRQIPLNPQVKVSLPKAMEPAQTARLLPVDFAKAAALWTTAQEFLIKEFAR